MMSDEQLRATLSNIESLINRLSDEKAAANSVAFDVIYKSTIDTAKHLHTNLEDIKKLREEAAKHKVGKFNDFMDGQTDK